jgi:hypothetical protein
MDVVQQFADKYNLPVPKTFMVAGASKVNKFRIFFSSSNRVIFLKF